MAQNFTVNDATSLNNAITTVNNSTGATAYTITFGNSISLGGATLNSITLANGASLAIDGANYTFTGNGSLGFTISSGAVTIENMTINNSTASLGYFADGNTKLAFKNTQFGGTANRLYVSAVYGNGIIDGSALVAPNNLYFQFNAPNPSVTSATLTLLGGPGYDVFQTYGVINSSVTVSGGGGGDEIFLSSGTQDISHVTGVNYFEFPGGGTSILTLTDANFAGIPGNQIGVKSDGNYSVTVDASTLSAAHSVYFIGGITVVGPFFSYEADTFKGGAGNDVFSFGAADLTASDTLVGGGGNDQLFMTSPGPINLPGVSGIGLYQLASGGVNSVNLKDAEFAGLAANRIQIIGGDGGNSIDVSLVSAAHNWSLTGGAGNDAFFVPALAATDPVNGNGGRDNLVVIQPGAADASAVSGITFLQLANGGADSLTLTDANFAGVGGKQIGVGGGDKGDTIDGSGLSAANSLWLIGGAGTDGFKGGAGNDVFSFTAANLTFADTVTGGGGSDELLLTSPGAIDASGVSGVRFYQLADGGPNSLALGEANFAGLAGGLIGVSGGNFGNTLDASQVAAPHSVWFIGNGGGTDIFVGGAGNDVFQFTAPSLTVADTVRGGGGNDELLITTPGYVAASGVSGVRFYQLASGGANKLTLTDGNFAGVAGSLIGVAGGAGGNTIDGSAVSSGHDLWLIGGAGSDVLKGGAGTNTLITGGGADSLSGGGASGTTYFELTDPSGSTLTNFMQNRDFIVFEKAGFDLGVDNGKANGSIQALDAGVFSAANDGGFTTTAQRFSYNQGNGQLLYAANGSATPAGSVVVAATLTGDPSLSLTNLGFTL